MPYTNIHKNARISPTKVRPIVDAIRGKRIDEAMSILLLSKTRGAVFVRNAVEAAEANADQAEANVRQLVITDARVDKGVTIKRFQPKDRGRAHPINKHCSHITVTVDEA